MAKGKLVLIIGPSGVGKSVILRKLRDSHGEIVFPRSATTRPRRPREGDELYRFVTDDAFNTLIANEAFLEYATVHGGARYGTLLSEIIPHIEKGKIVVREVDVQGFESIREHPIFMKDGGTHALQTIFILPESAEQLLAHIQKRAPMEDEELRRRIASMKKELLVAPETDVQVINREGRIDETISEVERAIGL